MAKGYTVDAEMWCESCLPYTLDDSEVEPMGGEADSPCHCNACHVPLDCDWTPDGVAFVVRALEGAMARGRIRETDRWEYGYYVGMPYWACLIDWADQLDWYHLDDAQRAILDAFNETFRPSVA